jgi:hypothetical protein
MSGGSYDYLYSKVKDMAEALDRKGESALRRAFGRHLKLIAEAMYDIEWVDSGDYAKGDEEEAIRKALSNESDMKELAILLEDARETHRKLGEIIERTDSSEA